MARSWFESAERFRSACAYAIDAIRADHPKLRVQQATNYLKLTGFPSDGWSGAQHVVGLRTEITVQRDHASGLVTLRTNGHFGELAPLVRLLAVYLTGDL